MAAAGTRGVMVVGDEGDLRATFRQVYGRLKSELFEDAAFDYTDEARRWIDRVLLHRNVSYTDEFRQIWDFICGDLTPMPSPLRS
ncbi:hypothetical protein GW17_00011573 [Ensete ventricosum]|nr:hypothetical protein GW17_00011573 [Ensete ventricosum]